MLQKLPAVLLWEEGRVGSRELKYSLQVREALQAGLGGAGVLQLQILQPLRQLSVWGALLLQFTETDKNDY